MAFSDLIRSLLVGTPWGETFPPRPAPPPPARDGRTAALETLRLFLSELTFYRRGDKNATLIPFSVDIDRIFVEWPDHEEQNGKEMPRVALISGGPVDYQSVGLGSWIDERTIDQFGRNTAIQVQSQYVETIFVDMICATKQERRAMLNGIVTALNPTELMYGIRFKMPDYYNEVVTFAVEKATINEDEDSTKGRRTARIELTMYFHQVALVNAEPLRPAVTVLTDFDPDAPDGEAVLYVPEGEEDLNAADIAAASITPTSNEAP